jgi:hypothetical protein
MPAPQKVVPKTANIFAFFFTARSSFWIMRLANIRTAPKRLRLLLPYADWVVSKALGRSAELP